MIVGDIAEQEKESTINLQEVAEQKEADILKKIDMELIKKIDTYFKKKMAQEDQKATP